MRIALSSNCEEAAEIAQLRVLTAWDIELSAGAFAAQPYMRVGADQRSRFMRTLSRAIAIVLILGAASVSGASAQVLNYPDPGLPDPNVTLQGRIPSPLPPPSLAPSIDGPMSSEPGLQPLPAQPPLMSAPPAAMAPPSVFQSQSGVSALQ
jgi:hypothetical protein